MGLDTSVPTVKYSYAELETLWINAGGPAAVAPVAAAIAMAESSGYSNNDNTTDPNGGSFGLWQINGANFQGDGSQMYDPAANAAAAVALWKNAGSTFAKDWSTAKGAAPAYLSFLSPSTAPAASASGTQVNGTGALGSAIGGPGSPLGVAFGVGTAIGGAIAKGTNTTGAGGGTRSPLDVGGQISDAMAGLESDANLWIFQGTLIAIALAIVAGGFAIAAAPSDPSGMPTLPAVIPV